MSAPVPANAQRVQSALDACAAALRGLTTAADDISEQSYRIGQTVEIKINTSAEDAEEHLKCHVSGEGQGEACEQAELSKAETEGWIVRFAPSVEDTFTLCVRWDERHISGSPFRLNFRGASEPEKIVVRGIEEGIRWTVAHPVHFKVDTRTAGKGQLIVRASGPTQGIPKFDLHDNGDGTYKATYIPSAEGEHSFEITYADQVIPGKAKRRILILWWCCKVACSRFKREWDFVVHGELRITHGNKTIGGSIAGVQSYTVPTDCSSVSEYGKRLVGILLWPSV